MVYSAGTRTVRRRGEFSPEAKGLVTGEAGGSVDLYKPVVGQKASRVVSEDGYKLGRRCCFVPRSDLVHPGLTAATSRRRSSKDDCKHE